MAWLYQRDGSQNWWIGWRVGGKQFLKSTRTANRKDAEKALEKFEVMAVAKRHGSLTEDFYNSLVGSLQPKVTLKFATDAWLTACKGTTSEGTLERYATVAAQFCAYFKADPLLRDIGKDEVTAFLADMSERRSAGSVNLTRKILSVFFNSAMASGHTTANPVKATKRFKAAKVDETKRRPFTAKEIGDLLKAAPDAFWRFMVIGGAYSGLRMGDLLSLRAREIKLGENKLEVTAAKTGKLLNIPIARPLMAELKARIKSRKNWKPADFLWPEQAELYQKRGAGPIAQDFYERVMVKAGLVEKRTHKTREDSDPNHGRRTVNEISFHSLRHSFVTMLKLSGASQSVAKELAGHSTDQISDLYTTIPIDVLSKAIKQLPEITQ